MWVLVFLLVLFPLPTRSSDLVFNKAAAQLLEQNFTDPDLSYLLVDATTGDLIASHWDDSNVPVPVGSLIKPFTALAYADAHGGSYPRALCHGTQDGCWWPRGHGRLGIEQAVAHSCNAYFRAISEGVTARQLSDELRRFRLAPMQSQAVTARFGIGDEWRASPLALAAAYRELASHARDAGTKEVLEGMRLAALSGTASEVDRALRAGKSSVGALAKTGTAPCTHARRAQADGFTLVMYPAEAPRLLLLVRRHGVTGSGSSHTAAAMLRLLVSPVPN